MKTVRKRYHDAMNKLGKAMMSISVVSQLIQHSRANNLPLDLDELVNMLKIGETATVEATEELTTLKAITYKLCDPNTDQDHLLEVKEA